MDNVFAVTSGKGGVGKTTTAINLAVAVGNEQRPVVVVDADLGMPDVGTFLDLDPAHTLHDVLAGEASVESALTAIAPGVDALVGNRDLGSFPDADPDELGSVIDHLAERYAYVFIDTGGGLSYEAVLPLELADAAVLVTSPQPAAIDNTKKSKQLADRAGVPVSGVVLTHSNGRADPRAIADGIGVPLLGSVPADPIVPESTERRQSLFEYAADSEAAAAYREIGAAVVGETEEPSPETSDSDPDPDPADDSSPERDSDGGDERDVDADPERGDVSVEEADEDPGEPPRAEPTETGESPESDDAVDPDGIEDVSEDASDEAEGDATSDAAEEVAVSGEAEGDATSDAAEEDVVSDEADGDVVSDEADEGGEPDESDDATGSAGDDTSAGASEDGERAESAGTDSAEESAETDDQSDAAEPATQGAESPEQNRSGGLFSRLFGWLR